MSDKVIRLAEKAADYNDLSCKRVTIEDILRDAARDVAREDSTFERGIFIMQRHDGSIAYYPANLRFVEVMGLLEATKFEIYHREFDQY